MNYIYTAIISVITSIITYFIFKSKNSSESKAVTEIKKETEIKIESTSTSEMKVDGKELEKKLKSEDYDTMVGRL